MAARPGFAGTAFSIAPAPAAALRWPAALAVPAADARVVLRRGLGAFWLLAGLLQLQPFMFRAAFARTVLAPVAQGQPRLIGAPILWSAGLVAHHPLPANASFAAIQLAIGLGLLFRRSLRPALVASFFWALGVWWLGEGLGGLLAGTASPLTGAPGAVLLYGLLGAALWPSLDLDRARGWAKGLWCAFWLGSAALWLTPALRAPLAIHDAMVSAAGNAPAALRGTLGALATAVGGHGLVLALAAAAVSATVGLGVFARRSCPFVVGGIALAVALWVVGQSAGGLMTGQSTDPNIGPLVVLLGVGVLVLGARAQGRRSAGSIETGKAAVTATRSPGRADPASA